MNKEIVKNYMVKANPWWSEGFNSSSNYKEREVYKEIAKFIHTRGGKVNESSYLL